MIQMCFMYVDIFPLLYAENRAEKVIESNKFHIWFLEIAGLFGILQRFWAPRCIWNQRGLVRHICISNITAIGSENDLSPSKHQASIWTNYH